MIKFIPGMALVTLVVFQLHSQQIQQLSVGNFEKKQYESKEHILLDVRTQDEFSRGHLPGAQCLDFYRKDFKEQLAKLDKEKPVFVYCAAGSRSHASAENLVGMGFRQVFDLQGGMNAWSSSNKSVVK